MIPVQTLPSMPISDQRDQLKAKWNSYCFNYMSIENSSFNSVKAGNERTARTLHNKWCSGENMGGLIIFRKQ